MNSNQIAANIIYSIIDSVCATKANVSQLTDSSKQIPVAKDEALLLRYEGGLNGSYMKTKLQTYQMEAYKSFQSDKLNLITHISSIEKFVMSCKKPAQQNDSSRDKSVVKIDNEFMTSVKKHKPKIMEEKERYEAARKLILSEKPIKRKHYEIENQNSNPNILNLESIFCSKDGCKLESSTQSICMEDDGYKCKKMKYMPPKNPTMIDISAVRSRVNTNLRI